MIVPSLIPPFILYHRDGLCNLGSVVGFSRYNWPFRCSRTKSRSGTKTWGMSASGHVNGQFPFNTSRAVSRCRSGKKLI